MPNDAEAYEDAVPNALAWACGQRPRAYFHDVNIAQLATVITATRASPSTKPTAITS